MNRPLELLVGFLLLVLGVVSVYLAFVLAGCAFLCPILAETVVYMMVSLVVGVIGTYVIGYALWG